MINISILNQEVISPCVALCQLDENDICSGCYRLVSEISGWLQMSEHEKRHIVTRCEMRKAKCLSYE